MSSNGTQAMSRDKQQFEKMTKTSIPKVVVEMAIPTVVSMVVSSLYNIADTYFVSRLGTSASGAVGIVLPLMAIIQAIGFTLGMGSGARISRLLGEKKQEESETVGICGLIAALVFGAILSVCGIVWLKPIMTLLGATPTILPYSTKYALYILIAAPFMTGSFVLNNLLRSQGKARFAMIGIGSGALLNVGLDPLFIFTLKMGISGAALATAISQAIGFFALLTPFLLKKTVILLTLKRFTLHPMQYLLTLKNGLPSLFRQGLASIATILLNREASVYGDAPVAAMSIVGKIFMIMFSIGLGIGQGYMPVAGYNYGAKLYQRVRKAFSFTFYMGTVIMSVFGLSMYILAPFIVGLFVSDDPMVGVYGVKALRYQCLAMPLLPLGVVCNMTFQTIGRSWTATFLSSLRQGLYFIPLIYILPHFFRLTGLLGAQPAADILCFITNIPFAICFIRSLPKEDGYGGADNLREAAQTNA